MDGALSRMKSEYKTLKRKHNRLIERAKLENEKMEASIKDGSFVHKFIHLFNNKRNFPSNWMSRIQYKAPCIISQSFPSSGFASGQKYIW